MSGNKTAVIIKGNPKYIEGNIEAERFYQQIKRFLEKLGYEVSFDAGLSDTLPPKADLWVGHSIGATRFRFAPKGIKLVSLGSSLPGSINHPKDHATPPDRYHYILTKKMKERIKEFLK